jgi:hypothetical protein
MTLAVQDDATAIAAAKGPWFRFLEEAMPQELYPVLTIIDDYMADLCVACRLATLADARCEAQVAYRCRLRLGSTCLPCLTPCKACKRQVCRDCCNMLTGSCTQCKTCHITTVRCMFCNTQLCTRCTQYCVSCGRFVCSGCKDGHQANCHSRRHAEEEDEEEEAEDDDVAEEVAEEDAEEEAEANEEPAKKASDSAELQRAIAASVEDDIVPPPAKRPRLYTRDRRTLLNLSSTSVCGQPDPSVT